MHIALKFEHLLEVFRRPDGHRWTGEELEKATAGVVLRSHVTNLRMARIESPSYEKLVALAKAMGFALKVWFEECAGTGVRVDLVEGSHNTAERVEHPCKSETTKTFKLEFTALLSGTGTERVELVRT